MMLSLKTLRAAGIGFVIVAGVSMCTLRDRQIETRGATKVVEAARKAGAKANEVNRKVRAAAREPGATERVREWCRDC